MRAAKNIFYINDQRPVTHHVAAGTISNCRNASADSANAAPYAYSALSISLKAGPSVLGQVPISDM